MMLVVGQEAGQVAQPRLGAGGLAATAVAVGAHHRSGGQHGVAQLRRSRPASAAVNRRAASVFWLTWSVFVMVTQVAEMPRVGPDRVQQPLVRVQPALQQRRNVARLTLVWPAICFMETSPMFALWQASRARLSGIILRQPRAEREHDHVDEAALGGGLDLLGLAAVVGREADEPHLAGLLDRLDGLLHLLALGPVGLLAAQAVEEEQVDVIGAERSQPLVDLLEHLPGSRT